MTAPEINRPGKLRSEPGGLSSMLLRPAELVPPAVLVRSAINAVIGILMLACVYVVIFSSDVLPEGVLEAAILFPMACVGAYIYLLLCFARNEMGGYPVRQHPVLLALSVAALACAHLIVAQMIGGDVDIYVLAILLVLPAAFLAGLPAWQVALVLLGSAGVTLAVLGEILPMPYLVIIVLSQVLFWSVFDVIIDEIRRHALSVVQLAELRGTRQMLDQVIEQETRTSIARELHDELGHLTTAISHNLSEFSYRHKPVSPLVENAMTMTQQLAAQVRAISHAWQDARFDVLAALRELAATIPVPRIHVDSEGFSGQMPARVGRALFRACQEMITNSLRHSNAGDVYLLFISHGGGLRVTIEDNGSGKKGLVPGKGLTSVKERLDELGIESTFSLGEDGFLAELDVPLK